ncbi:nucleotidyltransferase family protein [Thermophagus sp. OGC60D27]|uniref:nucleotidyltransferase family protein n=1 Tax=Thermophagus sp. OGC60D27 TaxID=3458415 RepID=UPI0040377C7B
MKPTLLILAAGMGSRYGGLKQMDELGPKGESIIDYSVYDAIRAGFGKVVFVIRSSFAEAFESRFEPRLKGKVETEYVFQELENIPAEFTVPEGREKPWGTGHAMLMAKDVIHEPFAIINADDFYGREAYESAFRFIQQHPDANQYAMVGYPLKNTLSDYGTVSRGVCETDNEGYLKDITERTKIGKENGDIFFYEGENKTRLSGNEPVSMNFWVFKPSFFDHLQNGFNKFMSEKGQELKSEYYFNTCADQTIKSGLATTKVITTNAQWFGITYKEDKPKVQNSIQQLTQQGIYPADLWRP